MPHNVPETATWPSPVTAPSNGDSANEASENNPAQALASRTLYLRTLARQTVAGRVYFEVFPQFRITDGHWSASSPEFGDPAITEPQNPLMATQLLAEGGAQYLWLRPILPFALSAASNLLFDGLKIVGMGLRGRSVPEMHDDLPEGLPKLQLVWQDEDGAVSNATTDLTLQDNSATKEAFEAPHTVTKVCNSIFQFGNKRLLAKLLGERGENALDNSYRPISAWVELGY